MTIVFNQIPEDLRIPGFYFEFDPSNANTGTSVKKLLVLGQRLDTGSVAAATPVMVTRAEQGDIYFGRGSQLSHMLAMVFQQRPTVAVWALALDDLPAGTAATGRITVEGTASATRTLRVKIGGAAITTAVTLDQTAEAMAGALTAAINAQTDYPVTAAVNGINGNQIDLTARHKGEAGNDLIIKLAFDGDEPPAAPTFTLTALSGGAGNPDITPAFAAMGDEWYNWLVCPWTDATNLTALDTELADRFSPLRQIGCRAFTAYRGTQAATAAFGDARNSPHVTTLGTSLTDQPPYLWAAANAAVAASSLAIDPTRQLQTLPLNGIEAPAPEYRWTFTERNLLLFDGISTYTVDSGGTVRLEAQITNYQENAQGITDDALLYLNIPEFYDAYRWEQRLLFAPYARDKFAADGDKLPAGQAIMTPSKARGLLLAWYNHTLIGEKGWCEDFAHYRDTLLVEKDGNRLKIVDQPNPIDNLRQVFGRSEMVQ